MQDDSGALTTYAYDAGNRLLSEQNASGVTTYSYDADGNRMEKETPAAVTYYTWDEDSRLTVAEPVAGPVTFTYDADGRRVEKETPSETTKFVYDLKKILQETDGTGSVERHYTFTDKEYGDLISEFDGSDTSYHHYDAVGMTDALLDDSETATDQYQHRAFGIEESHTGTSDSPFTFVGRQSYYRDPELDLYLVGARYYDPQAGRWASKDPIGFEAGDANLYQYVGNNPVNDVDPSGNEGWGELKAKIHGAFLAARLGAQTARDKSSEFAQADTTPFYMQGGDTAVMRRLAVGTISSFAGAAHGLISEKEQQYFGGGGTSQSVFEASAVVNSQSEVIDLQVGDPIAKAEAGRRIAQGVSELFVPGSSEKLGIDQPIGETTTDRINRFLERVSPTSAANGRAFAPVVGLGTDIAIGLLTGGGSAIASVGRTAAQSGMRAAVRNAARSAFRSLDDLGTLRVGSDSGFGVQRQSLFGGEGRSAPPT